MGNKHGKQKISDGQSSRDDLDSNLSYGSRKSSVNRPMGNQDLAILQQSRGPQPVPNGQGNTSPQVVNNQMLTFGNSPNSYGGIQGPQMHGGFKGQPVPGGIQMSPPQGQPVQGRIQGQTVQGRIQGQSPPMNSGTPGQPGLARIQVSHPQGGFQSPSASGGVQSPSASGGVQSPSASGGVHKNPVRTSRSMSVDMLESPHSPQNNLLNVSSDSGQRFVDRRSSVDELANRPKAVIKALQQHYDSPALPPKNSPHSSPKITRKPFGVQNAASKLTHNPRSSPMLARKGSTKRALQVQARLAKSLDDLQLIIPDVEPAPMPNEKKAIVFQAMFDFDAINDDDLSFKKGDRLKKVNANDTADWVICINLTTGGKGYIPVNYVSLDDDSPQAQEWWFECSRSDAETWLMRLGVMTGSFLIRQATDKRSYALSVRWQEPDGRMPCVRHYKIRMTDDGQNVFIGTRRLFPNVNKLVAHYREKEDGLVCKLTLPCPRIAPVTHLRSIEVKREAIRFTEKLGAGYFGEVWKGKLRGKLDIAIKTLKPGRMTPFDFLQEGRAMNKLRHVRLVQLLAVCTDCEPLLLITEYMPNGALLDYLRKDRRSKLEFMTMINMTRQVAEGMAYLEANNYIHRDLRAGNILVGEHMDVKVADFGLARVVDNGQYVAGGSRFPIKWTAPEAVSYSKFSIKSDVWSFGILMYEIATSGKEPYAGMTPAEAVHEIHNGFRLPKPREHWTPAQIDPYYAVMQLCWKKEAKDRPSFLHLHLVFEDFTVQTEMDYGDVQ